MWLLKSNRLNNQEHEKLGFNILCKSGIQDRAGDFAWKKNHHLLLVTRWKSDVWMLGLWFLFAVTLHRCRTNLSLVTSGPLHLSIHCHLSRDTNKPMTKGQREHFRLKGMVLINAGIGHPFELGCSSTLPRGDARCFLLIPLPPRPVWFSLLRPGSAAWLQCFSVCLLWLLYSFSGTPDELKANCQLSTVHSV